MLTKKANLLRVLKNIYLTRNEPVSLVHFVTNRCNARCSFCFIDFENPDTFKSELTIEEIEKLVKNLGKSLLNVKKYYLGTEEAHYYSFMDNILLNNWDLVSRG